VLVIRVLEIRVYFGQSRQVYSTSVAKYVHRAHFCERAALSCSVFTELIRV
jgi:hypothetical protein